MTTTEWATIRDASIHNGTGTEVTLGKWEGVDNPASYTEQAKKTGNEYFDLGSEWNTIRNRHDLTERDMFTLFNRPFLDNAIADGKTIKFTHNPIGDKGALGKELQYLESRGYEYNPGKMTATKG